MANKASKALILRQNTELAQLSGRAGQARVVEDADARLLAGDLLPHDVLPEDVFPEDVLPEDLLSDGLLDAELLSAIDLDPDLLDTEAISQVIDADTTPSTNTLPAVVSRELQPWDANVPGMNLEAYMRSVNSLPMLTAEQEKALAMRLFYQQDVAAARQLVLSHLRFVVHIAKSYKGYGLPQADLIQEGNVGLMKAVKRFDPNVGVRLVSFAVHWIKAEIHEYVLKNWRIVKVATTKAQRKLFFNLRSAKKTLGWLSQAEAEQVAKDLGVDVKDVKEMENRLAAHDAAFDMSADHDDDVGLSPVQYLEDKNADPAMQFEQDDWSENESLRLQNAMDTLDERSRSILERRWLADKKATLHELAADFQVSAERIRQLEQSAFKKLKAAFV